MNELNTSFNKKQFFHLYSGQVFQTSNSESVINWMLFKHWDDYKTRCQIPLKLVDNISQVDAMYCVKLLNYKWNQENNKYAKDYMNGYFIRQDLISYPVADYLRSKGYALSFKGISIKEQVKFGWIKIVK